MCFGQGPTGQPGDAGPPGLPGASGPLVSDDVTEKMGETDQVLLDQWCLCRVPEGSEVNQDHEEWRGFLDRRSGFHHRLVSCSP